MNWFEVGESYTSANLTQPRFNGETWVWTVDGLMSWEVWVSHSKPDLHIATRKQAGSLRYKKLISRPADDEPSTSLLSSPYFPVQLIYYAVISFSI